MNEVLKEKENGGEMQCLLLAFSVFACVLAGYAINSAFLYLAIGILAFVIVSIKSAPLVIMPFAIIATWGAEIWSGANYRAYTLLKLLTIALFIYRNGIITNTKRLLRTNQFGIAIVVWFAYCLMGCFISGYGGYDKALNLFLCYIVIYLFTKRAYSDDFQLLAFSFAIGTFLSACISWIAPSIPRLNVIVRLMIKTYNLYGTMRRLSALTYDPNLYGFYVIVAVALMLTNMHLKKYKHVILESILAIALAICGLLTLSKAYILTLILLGLSYAIIGLNSSSIKPGRKLIIIVFLLAAVIIGYFYFNEYISAVLSRFNGDDLADITTGRSNNWVYYIEYLSSHPRILIVGNSINGGLEGRSTPHNFILYMLFQFGILGFSLFLYMISSLLRCSNARILGFIKTNGMNSIYRLLPIFTLLIYIMSIDPFMLYDVKMVMLPGCFYLLKRDGEQ